MTSNDILTECQWPGLPERFEIALRKAVEFILVRYDVLGIIASGTIVRGAPDPSSDLDIYVIHEKPVRQRVQKIFQGIPAEIFVNPVPTIRKYFSEEHVDGRPITAHMLATGWVILSRDAAVEELRSEAQDWLSKPSRPSSSKLLWDRYMIATQYEDALDVAAKDPSVAMLLLTEAVIGMLRFWYRSNGHFIPRSKELLSKLVSMDEDIGKAAEQFFTDQTERRWALAEKIADRTIKARGFFEWESEPETMGSVEGNDCRR